MDFDALMKQYVAGDEVSPEVGGHVTDSGAVSSLPIKKRAHRSKRRFAPREPGQIEELGQGEYKLIALHGAYDLWNDDWWGRPDDLIVVFEAKASNDVTVVLSVDKGVTTGGNLYEIVVGGWKNTKSTIRTETQGQERATSFDSGMCNAETFLTYWIALKNGVLAVGLGDKPGRGAILIWKHPQHDIEDVQPCWVSFTSWDNTVHLRNVRMIDSTSLDNDWVAELGDPTEWTAKYIPPYVAAFEEERAANIARAERFGVSFVPPSSSRALGRMSHVDREKARASMAGRLRTGFATGFDIESAEEVEHRKARAARFGLSEQPSEGKSTPQLSSTVAALLPSEEDMAAKRNRAARFGVTLNEQVKLAGLAEEVSIARMNPTSDDVPRADTLHLFGNLSKIFSKHILHAFQDFNPSHIEWLNDFSCNIVFADAFTCERAKVGLCRAIPAPIPLPEEAPLTPERIRIDNELNNLISAGWQFTAVKANRDETQYILVRNATSADIKSTGTVVSGERKRHTDAVGSPFVESPALGEEPGEDEGGRKRLRKGTGEEDD